jgi:hypothetical protein
VRYLVEWAFALYGRSGLGFSGAAPLSYQEVGEWSRLTDTPLESWEVEGLMALDAAIRDAQADEDEPKQDEPVVVPRDDAWPTRAPAE